MSASPNRSFSLEQAAGLAPALAHFQKLSAESTSRMAIVRAHLPPALAHQVQPGVPEGDEWVLLVPNNAAAAKLRQLAPQLAALLRSAGHAVQSVGVKVARHPR